MLKTVLEADSCFGIVRVNPATKKLEDVGCCAQIIKHHTSEDGRSNIITLGQQRFRVLEIIREAPFITALVITFVIIWWWLFLKLVPEQYLLAKEAEEKI